MKKVILLMIIFVVAFCVSVSAAPGGISVDDRGNTNGLIVLTSPQNQKASTFEKSYIISGYGKEGVRVFIYAYSPSDGVYKKMYINGEEAAFSIGSSGLFMKQVDVSRGKNAMLLRAEVGNNGSYQIVKFEIAQMDYNLINVIKGMFSK